MNTRTLIAALAFAATGTAFAQEATYEPPQAAVSAVSRASVQAELAQARADGTLQIGEAGTPVTPFVAQKTRAEVRAETLAAIASGEFRELTREPYSAYVGKLPAPRAEVPLRTAAAK